MKNKKYLLAVVIVGLPILALAQPVGSPRVSQPSSQVNTGQKPAQLPSNNNHDQTYGNIGGGSNNNLWNTNWPATNGVASNWNGMNATNGMTNTVNPYNRYANYTNPYANYTNPYFNYTNPSATNH
jgi:hypothetical protein